MAVREHVPAPRPPRNAGRAAIVLSLLAIAAALAGGSYAANRIGAKQIKNGAVTSKKLAKKSVTAKKIRKGAVTAKKIRKGAVTSSRIRNGAVTAAKIADDSLTGNEVAEATLGRVPRVEGFEILEERIVSSSASAALFDDALAAAAKVPLIDRGPISIHGRCFQSGANVQAYVVVETSTGEAVVSPSGGLDTITPSTPIGHRAPLGTGASANSIGLEDPSSSMLAVAYPGGYVEATLAIAAKQGTPPAGNGFFGAGNRCLFGGSFRFG